MKAKYGITFSQSTPESVEHGDYSKTGWRAEYTPYERGDLRHLKSDGFRAEYEGASWFSTGFECIDYRTGTEEARALHFEGITAATHKRIARYLAGKRVLGVTPC